MPSRRRAGWCPWRNQLRIQRALTLLAEGRAAADAGWTTTSAFIETFAQIIGVTPGRYLEDLRSARDRLGGHPDNVPARTADAAANQASRHWPRAGRPVAGEPVPGGCHAFAVPVEPPPAPQRGVTGSTPARADRAGSRPASADHGRLPVRGGSRLGRGQRQYTGTAGKITNCQLGVCLAYAGPKGRALVDRELYLPRSWTGDESRLTAAKVPEGTSFATKPQLLRMMIERAIAAGIPFRWVTADEAYEDNGPLRGFLEERQVAYVMAASRDQVASPVPVGDLASYPHGGRVSSRPAGSGGAWSLMGKGRPLEPRRCHLSGSASNVRMTMIAVAPHLR